MWIYRQSTGRLLDPAGLVKATGYSGHGDGLNNPALECDAGVGPIPAGLWTIGEPKTPPDHLGPLAMPLTLTRGDAHGRSAFFIHGDFPSDASELASRGCIVLSYPVRAAINASSDRGLKVIP